MLSIKVNGFFRFAFHQIKNKEMCDKEFPIVRCDPSLFKQGEDRLKCMKCFEKRELDIRRTDGKFIEGRF